jgi:hypothetical protein
VPNSEYQELIAFVGRKFEEVDARLDQMATKEELRTQQAETRRHFEVVAERMQSQVRLVAEGIAEVSQRLDRRTAEITAKIEQESAETRAMIRLSYAQVERRIQELESNYASVYRPLSNPDSATCAEPCPERSRRAGRSIRIRAVHSYPRTFVHCRRWCVPASQPFSIPAVVMSHAPCATREILNF